MTVGIDRARLLGPILSGKDVDINIYGAGVYDGTFGSSMSEKREHKLVQGSRKDLTPIGMTCGEYVPGAFTVKMAVQSAMMVKEGLAALAGGTSYGDAVFDLTMALSRNDNPNAPVILYAFADVVLVEPKLDTASTIDELVEELGFMYLRSNVNGLTLFSANT